MSQALFHELFTARTPLLDVRAEVEFEKGAFPTSVNLPILNDAEREKVGTCYHRHGPAAAARLGHRLVSGETRRERLRAWIDFIDRQPSAWLYCFRGGQRSAIAAEWLAAEGIRVPRIPGGYKALRRFLLQCLAQTPPLILLAGRTGTGKTAVLKRIAARRPRQVIDLEGHANHRGSAFGKYLTPQPTQINFENTLAIDLLDGGGPRVVEDESKLIGHLLIPPPVQERMNQAPMLVLDATIDSRIEHIRQEYVVALWHELQHTGGDHQQTLAKQAQILYRALDSIKKRLGGANHRAARLAMEAAFCAQRSGDFTLHAVWIRQLLENYYDPMYDYQLAQRADRVLFTGNEDALLEYAVRLLDRHCELP